MDLVDAGQLLFLAGVAILSCLWLLHKLAPSQSVSRLQAEYGLRQEYPAREEPTQSTRSIDDGVTMEYV